MPVLDPGISTNYEVWLQAVQAALVATSSTYNELNTMLPLVLIRFEGFGYRPLFYNNPFGQPAIDAYAHLNPNYNGIHRANGTIEYAPSFTNTVDIPPGSDGSGGSVSAPSDATSSNTLTGAFAAGFDYVGAIKYAFNRKYTHDTTSGKWWQWMDSSRGYEVWNPVGNFVSGLTSTVSNSTGIDLSGILSQLTNIMNSLHSTSNTITVNVAGGQVPDIGSVIQQIGNAVVTNATAFLQNPITGFQSIVDKITSGINQNNASNENAFARLGEKLGLAINAALLDPYETLKNLPANLVSAIGQLNQNQPDIVGAIKTLFNENSNLLAATFAAQKDSPEKVIENRTDIFSRIGELVDAELAKIGMGLKDFISFSGQYLPTILGQGIVNLNSDLHNKGETIDKLLNGKYDTYDQFYKDINLNIRGHNVASDIQNAFTVAFGILIYVKAKLDPLSKTITQLENAKYTPEINDVNSLVSSYFKGTIDYKYLAKELNKHGYDDERIKIILDSNIAVLSINELMPAFNRGLISSATVNKTLTSRGYDDKTIVTIRQLFDVLPTPTDLTRLADKHIFDKDIDTRFGQYNEIPNDYIDAMAKQGISPEWTTKLWGAHWSLPGMNNILDMYHRGIISLEEVNVYFKLTDIIPFFRDKLIELNFNLVTRVDIRRMYAVGVYGESDVYNAYVRNGYSPHDARDLTNFTVIHERQSEESHKVKVRELSLSLIIQAFNMGVINHDQAIARLDVLGYPVEDSALILRIEAQKSNLNVKLDKTQLYHDKAVSLLLREYSNGVLSRTETETELISLSVPYGEAQLELHYADIERLTNLKSEIIDKVKDAYLKGHLTKQSAFNLMSTHGFQSSEIELLFSELDILSSLKYKDLTLAQIAKFFKDGIIFEADVVAEVDKMDYSDLHKSWVVKEIIGVK